MSSLHIEPWKARLPTTAWIKAEKLGFLPQQQAAAQCRREHSHTCLRSWCLQLHGPSHSVDKDQLKAVVKYLEKGSFFPHHRPLHLSGESSPVGSSDIYLIWVQFQSGMRGRSSQQVPGASLMSKVPLITHEFVNNTWSLFFPQCFTAPVPDST